MDRRMFDTPVLPRLETILGEVKAGELVVPEFQRPYVWDDDARLQLFDSIAGGLPIGSFLVWRTTRRDLRTYDRVGGVRLAQRSAGTDKIAYLIDGHQRLSTLFGALNPADPAPAAEDQDWRLYYELGTRDRPAFRTPPRRGEVPPHWLPLSILFDGDRLFDFTKALRERGQRDLAKEAERLANVFRDYIIPIIPLVTDDLNLVTDAFVRVNSTGAEMTEAHMLRALTYLSQASTDVAFAAVRERLAPEGWASLNEQVLVNVLKAALDLDIYSANVDRVHQNLKADPAVLTRMPDILGDAVALLAAVGVRGPGALPYTHQLVCLAMLCARLAPAQRANPAVREHVRRWFWRTTYTERFKGITGDQLRTVIAQLVAGAQIPAGSPGAGGNLVRPLRSLRRKSVRTQAFLLFLAQLPRSAEARARRQEWLGSSGSPYGSLFPGLVAAPRVQPGGLAGSLFPEDTGMTAWLRGNCVLASPAELRRLRFALQQGGVPEEMADEFALPAAAVNRPFDIGALLAARDAELRAKEAELLQDLGLEPEEE